MVRVLSRLWAEPRPGASDPSPSRAEVVVATAVLVIAVVEVLLRGDLGWAGLPVGLGVALGVVLRRVNPLAAVSCGFGTIASVDLLARLSGSPPVTVWVAAVVVAGLYALTRWGSGRELVLGGGVVTGCLGVIAWADTSTAQEWVGGVGMLLAVAAWGLVGRLRAQARTDLLERVRAQEREHLARELHDTVAHHLSAIIVQAQAGRMLLSTGSTGRAGEAMDVIGDEAHRTLTEMRSMVGLLRDAGSGGSEQHRLADLSELAVQRFEDLTVSVTLAELPALAPPVESALFRVAQEAVTNAHRHARRARHIAIDVRAEAEVVRLSVRDDGTSAGSAQRGYGLTGMHERITLLGGTFAAGPAEDGGWHVTVALPIGGGRP